MGDASHLIVLPPTIRAYLGDRLRRRWERDAERVIGALPESLPAGQVERLFSGGPFGWMLEARLDEIDGRVALEVLEDNRMSGPEHYRVWEDGSREELESETTGMILPANCSPGERQRIKDEYYAHNRGVQDLLRQRGFRRTPD